MDIKKETAKLLKEFREEHQYSLRDLEWRIALDTGYPVVSAQVINQWEKERSIPSPRLLRFIALCTHKDISELGVKLLALQGLGLELLA